MNNLITKISGYKTYILAVGGILIALIGHFWGPVHIAEGLDIPGITWGEFWTIVWNSGLFAFLRMGVKKSEFAAEGIPAK